MSQIQNTKQLNVFEYLRLYRISFRASGFKFSKAAFTYIELILVVAIVLTLSASSAVFYSRFFLQNSVAHTADQIVGTLRKAQMYAMFSKRVDSWSVNYSSDKITLYKGTNFGSRNTAFDETFSVTSNVSVTGLTTDVSFSRVTGLPNVTPTITVSGGNNIKTINVNSQGMVNR